MTWQIMNDSVYQTFLAECRDKFLGSSRMTVRWILQSMGGQRSLAVLPKARDILYMEHKLHQPVVVRLHQLQAHQVRLRLHRHLQHQPAAQVLQPVPAQQRPVLAPLQLAPVPQQRPVQVRQAPVRPLRPQARLRLVLLLPQARLRQALRQVRVRLRVLRQRILNRKEKLWRTK